VDAMLGPMEDETDRGPAEMGGKLDVAPTRCKGIGFGRKPVEAGELAVEAGASACAFFSAACRIWSLQNDLAALRWEELHSTYSSKFRQAQQTTHSTQSSFPVPRVCQTCFSSSLFPVMVIRVPPPFSGGFFATFPNCARHQHPAHTSIWPGLFDSAPKGCFQPAEQRRRRITTQMLLHPPGRPYFAT
jgi:hypothetical protein